MRKKELEIILESLSTFENPKIELEQYVTPSPLAAEIAINASLFGDLDTVADLGCGTGILGIAAALLGAKVIGFDIDLEALKIARRNAQNLGLDINFVRIKVEDIHLKKKVTTMMNPPFGIQKRHADRVFLEKAFEISRVIYSIHSAGSESFIKKMAESNGFKVTHLWKYSIPLKRQYNFHVQKVKYIPVEVYRMEEI